MARSLTADDVESALIGGLLLSAGGSGKRSAARGRALGRVALDYNTVRLASLDELNPDDRVITATAIGAPGVPNPAVVPRDSIDSARRLVAMLDQRPIGVICGHVPGFNAWLVAAALGLDYVDAASNGRGHPTVKMGGMGLASRPDISIIQVASSRGAAANSPLQFVAEGDIVRTSNVMRQAAVVNGGLIYAARGPLTAGFIKENGAAGAITFQLELGRAVLRANGTDRVQAAIEFLGGTLLLQGEVSANTVTYGGGFDLGLQRIHDRRYRWPARCYISRHDRDARPCDRRAGGDLGIASRQPSRGHYRSPLQISGRQGSARSGRVSRGRESHGCRPALVSLIEEA